MASGALSAGDLRDMKVLQDDQGTRAVLEMKGMGRYKLFTLANPDRLVLDLDDARLAPGFDLPAPNGAIANVRTGKPVAGTLRIVFDLGSVMTTSSRVEHEGPLTRLIVELAPPGAAGATPTPALALQPSAAQPSERPPIRIESAALAPANFQPPGQSAPTATQPQPGPASPSPMDALVLPTQVSTAPALPQTSRPVAQGPARPAPAVAAPIASRAPARTIQDVLGSSQRRLVVAIDAGHGGKDPGALGPSGVREKVVTLAVARELARQINADPGMRAVLIRDADTFVPLKQRYMKARAAQADLFISIHADASPNNSASGASVFVLSTRGASSQAARWLADQENAADLVGGVSLDQKDPNLAAVLLDLSQSATMRASDDIANQVLGSLKNVGKAHKPSIERANFVVLRSPDVPSMLIETGFITNPSEEQRLNDAGYRGRLASAIASGVRKYFTSQAPAGSWYASRSTFGNGDSAAAPWIASSPE